MKCLFCGARVTSEMTTCETCGAPIKVKVVNVYVDLSGVSEPVNLTIAKSPFMRENMLPSRLFDLSFDDQTAELTYRGPKQQSGGGAVAMGNNAVAVGAGGFYCAGKVTGNVIVGNNNISINSSNGSRKVEPIVAALFLPEGVENIIVNGNGKTNCEVSYPGVEVTPANATIL